MIEPLDSNHINAIRKDVRYYAGLDLDRYVSRFYRYGREDRVTLGNHDFAVTTKEDGGRIYLELPISDNLCSKCRAFVLLHELSHVLGVNSHSRTTNHAIALLRARGKVDSDWLDSLKRRWRLADNVNALNDTARQILENRGLTRKQVKYLYEEAARYIKQEKPIPKRLDAAFDESRVSLLCRSVVPDPMKGMITELGRLWAKYPHRMRPRAYAVRHWDRLVSDWSEDPSLPLYVRKPSLGRGKEIPHEQSGRRIVFTDNSPARWAFLMAWQGRTPSIKEIAEMVRNDQIPVTQARSKKEIRMAHYIRTLDAFENENPISKEWKVGHIDQVGLKIQGNPTRLGLRILQQHFMRLMSPSNMFVVPKDYAGLAELPEFIRQIR